MSKILDHKLELYVLLELRQQSNKCFYCKIYQYDEKCRDKSRKNKYWHCCFNDKIFNNIRTFENDDDVINVLFDDFEKNATRMFKIKVKRKLYDLLY